MSIRARLLLLILFATLIPALVGGMQFLERRDSEIADAQRDLAAAARQVAQDLRDTIRGTAQLHYGLSRARDLDTQDRAACSEFLANVLKEYPQYTGILTIKPNGDLFCDSLRTGRALNLTDRRYFQDALNSKNPLAVEPVFGRLTGIAVLQVAYAARRETGEPRFVLLASLNLEKYMQFRAQALPRQNAVIALVDGKGTVLTWHPAGEKLRGTSIADSPLFRFARERQGKGVREDIEFGGASRIWAASALPEFPEAGLHILVGVSRKDLLAAANRNLGEALATLAVVWLLVFAGAWALVDLGARRQAARIIAAVARFSGGAFDARIGKPYPRGEIGNLMAALDHAFELMQTQRDVIQGLNADLERRVAEHTAQLRESEERNRAIVDTAVDPIIVIDERGVIQRFNLGAERTFGYQAAEAIGKNVSVLMPSPYREQHDGYLANYLATGEARIIGIGRELIARRKDGATFPIYLAVSEVRVGERRTFVGIIRDITEAKLAAERQAQLVTSLAAANKELESFSYSVAHDLRAPLRAIDGYALILEEDHAAHLDAEGKRTLSVVRGEAQRMGQLIDDLLAFSRLGRSALAIQEVDMAALIRAVVDELTPAATSRPQLAVREMPKANGDPALLRQAWVNLISNAIKFTGPCAQPRIEIGGHRDGGRCVWFVRDNGVGFDMRYYDKMFGVFQRFHRAEDFPGTGVGLAIVSRIVARHGGTVWAEGKVDGGATFYFALPKENAHERD